MSQTVQANPKALIESIARVLPPSARDDARNLLSLYLDNLTALSPGGNLLQLGGAKAGASAAPQGVAHSVAGANAQYSVSIQNPATPQGTQIWHEFSYSPVKSFTKNVTTLPATTATSFQVPAVGVKAYTRIRSSFDQKTWSSYQLSSTDPIDAGHVSSSAIAKAAAFNQTNYAVVNSQKNGGLLTVTVNGTGGDFTPYTAVRGSTESLRPSATIVGLEEGTQQFVTYDGSQFHIAPNVAQALSDDVEPVGSVVVGSGQSGGGGTNGRNDGRLVGTY